MKRKKSPLTLSRDNIFLFSIENIFLFSSSNQAGKHFSVFQRKHFSVFSTLTRHNALLVVFVRERIMVNNDKCDILTVFRIQV
jgi:hypothetical protein